DAALSGERPSQPHALPKNAKYTAPTMNSIETTVFHRGDSPNASQAYTMKTARVMHSCDTLSCVSENFSDPIRLAGTWKMYSASAISQLTRMASTSGWFLCLRWPYQAIVMNVFEIVSSRTNLSVVLMAASLRLRASPAHSHSIVPGGLLVTS